MASQSFGFESKAVFSTLTASEMRRIDPLEWLLPKLGFGVVILDERKTVIDYNSRAKRFLPSGFQTGERFPLSPAEREQPLEVLLQDAIDSESKYAALRIGKISVPVAIAAFRAGVGDQRFLILFEQDSLTSDGNLNFLVTQYELTATEVRIVEHLMNGLVPKQIAIRHNVAQSTIRTQIKSILTKTNTNRIGSLILLVARLPRVSDADPIH